MADPASRLPDLPAARPPVLREQPLADASVPRMELREWRERFGVVAGLTTRDREFSLGLWSEEAVGQVMTRWRALHAAFRPAFPTVISSHQVHGTLVHWHQPATGGWLVIDGVDGHAAGTRGSLLTITIADCIPVYLVAPDRGVAALLHAGWRGTAGRILERGVEVLRREARVAPGDIVMHCGVGICGSCYEVGAEVLTELTGRTEAAPERVDLRGVLARQARQLGLGEVSLSPWCSAHDRALFFSHRASGGRDGRMVAYLGMPRA